MELLIASRNPGKISEIRDVLDIPGLQILTREELGDWPEPEETGADLEANAVIKATALRDLFDRAALADDSGLEVDALGGRPGVRSSRYAGPEGDADRNMARLLSELEGVADEDRTARFACVMALVLPSGSIETTRGVCEGRILTERRGSGGFGYDPVFLPEGFDMTMAELSIEEKNRISHRGKALRAMRDLLSPGGRGPAGLLLER